MLKNINDIIKKTSLLEKTTAYVVSLCFLLLLMVTSIVAEVKIFYYALIFIFYILTVIFFLSVVYSFFIKRPNFSFRIFFSILLVALLIILIVLPYSNYRLEGAHDPGVYFENANLIAKTTDFKIENILSSTYPGFSIYKGHTVSNFPPGYPTYLSIFVLTGKNFGIPISNGLILVLSLLIFYLIIKKLKGNKTVFIIFLILFLINFYTIYFLRSTYSESLQLLLMWFAFLCLIEGERKKLFLYTGFIPISLLLLIRAEAILNLILYTIIFVYLCNTDKIKKEVLPRKYKLIVLAFICFSITLLAVYNTLIFNYLELNYGNIFNSLIGKTDFSSERLGYNPTIINLYYTLTVLKPIGFVILLVLSLLYALKKISTPRWLIPFIIFLPQLFYIIKSGIAFYLPWFMRRLWPIAIITIILLFSFYINSNKFRKLSKILVISCILVLNIIPSSEIITFKEEGPQEQTLDIIKDNPDSYFIFLDKFGIEAYGPPEFFDKNYNTIYDRLPQADNELYDILLKDQKKKIYLLSSLAPEDNFIFYGTNLNTNNLISEINYTLKSIAQGCNIRPYIVNPSRFNSLELIGTNCKLNNPPTKRIVEYKKLFIYSIDNNLSNQNRDEKELKYFLIKDLEGEIQSYKTT